jgi:hypothetical protein
MEYNSDMHFALLTTEDGVSLERISLTRDANDKSNWHSAAESVGYATPAYKNSQFSENSESNDEITIDTKIILLLIILLHNLDMLLMLKSLIRKEG